MLSSSLEAGIERATLGATRTMLETELPLRDKLPVTWALRTAIEEAPRGQVPDLAGEFDERGAEGDNAMARARDGLMDDGHRRRHPIVPPGVRRRRRAGRAGRRAGTARRRSHGAASDGAGEPARWSTVGVGALALAGVGVLGVEWPPAPASIGEYVAADPCTAPPDPYPGGGLDGIVQRIALSALNGAACELGTTRERLVLSLDPTAATTTSRGTRRPPRRRCASAPSGRSTTPTTGTRSPAGSPPILRFAVDRAPISWLVEASPDPRITHPEPFGHRDPHAVQTREGSRTPRMPNGVTSRPGRPSRPSATGLALLTIGVSAIGVSDGRRGQHPRCARRSPLVGGGVG